MRKINGIIYLATNIINSMQYIGLTTKTLKRRIIGHTSAAIRGKGSEHSLQEAIRIFGLRNITFEVIDRAESAEELCLKEIKNIKKYNSLVPMGYNQNRGGALNRDSGKIYEVEGEIYSSLTELAEAYDVLEITMHKRMQSGTWTLEQACNIEPPPKIEISGIKIELEGITYQSFQKACEHYSLDKRIVNMRMNRLGWSLEEAFELELRKNPHQIIINGEEFQSFKAACEHFKLNVKKVESRIRLGWSLKEAFDIEERPFEWIKCGTEKFKTHKEIAQRYGMKYSLLRSRMQAKWTLEQAVGLEQPPRRKTSNGAKSLLVNGKEFKSKEEVYRFYAIEGSRCRYYLWQGKTFEEAISILTTPPQQEQIVVEQKTFSNLSEAANAYNLKPKTVAYRLKVGWTVAEAFGLVPAPNNNPRYGTIEVDGKQFPSIAAAADYFAVNLSNVRFRIKQNWTIRQCFELDPPPSQAVNHYLVTGPDGKEYNVNDLTFFAREHGMPKGGAGLKRVAFSKKLHSWKGWKITKIEDKVKDQI